MGQNLRTSALPLAIVCLARQAFIHTMRAFITVFYNILQRMLYMTSNLNIPAWIQQPFCYLLNKNTS
jgi:hypothetical protein